jgi:CubicO group peptidase (beta-lactamase class C family)
MPGLSVAVIKGGQIVWTKNLGYADLDHHIAATSDTLYGIGSISKIFAGAALMYVRDQGKLAIDDPVSRFAELPIRSRFPDSPPLTFRMLANHTAGLPYMPALPFAYGNQYVGGYPFPSREEMAKSLHVLDLLVAPNTQYIYSGLGFDLMALGIEKAAGTRFEDIVAQHFLKPLGMDNTGYTLSSGMHSRLAVGYWPGSPQAIMTQPYPAAEESHGKAPLVFPPAASGGLFSSVSDLSKFIAFQLTPLKGTSPLRPASVREMQWNRLGWEHQARGNYNVFEHYGGTSGYSGYMGIVPDLDFGIVVLANISFRDLAIATRMIDALIPAMKAEREKKDLAQATALMIEARQFAGQYTVLNEDVLRYSIPGKLVLTLDAQGSSFRVTSSLISEVQKYLPTFPERTEFVPLTSTDFLIHGNCFHMSWTICEGDAVRFSKDEKGLISFRWGALIFQRRPGPPGSSLRCSASPGMARAAVRTSKRPVW